MLRPFVQEDMLPYRRLMSICYTYALENPDKPVEADEKTLRQHYGIFGENGSLQSAMTQLPLTCWFEGQRVPLLGIGGVVTDPTARCGGGVRRLFEEGLPASTARATCSAHSIPSAMFFTASSAMNMPFVGAWCSSSPAICAGASFGGFHSSRSPGGR